MQFIKEVKELIRLSFEAFWLMLKLTIAMTVIIAPIFIGMSAANHEQSFVIGVLTIVFCYAIIFSLFHVIEDKI
jgi:hypothetical protein